MTSVGSLLLCLAVLPTAGSAGAQTSRLARGGVDWTAMREAMRAPSPEEAAFASSASYAHFLKARLLHDQGRALEEIEQLELALATRPGNPYLLTSVSEAYARVGELSRADQQLRQLLAAHPRYFPARLLLGRVLLEEKKGALARVQLERACQLEPRRTEPYLLLAQAALEKGDLDRASQRVERMAQQTGDPVGLKRLGSALLERGERRRARPLLERATQMDPGDAESWLLLAQVEDGLDQDGAAEAAYGQALRRDPDNTDALLSAGRLCLKRGDLSSARAYFDRLWELSDQPEVAVKIAFSYLAAQHVQEAAQILEEARKKSPTEPRLAFYAGLVQERRGDYPSAAADFGRVSADADLGREANLHLATSLARSGRQADALALLQRELLSRPDDVELYVTYAQVMQLGGDRLGSESFLRLALQQHPAAELYEAFADLLERTGRAQEAVGVLKTAVMSHPGDELLRFALASAYERIGALDASLRQMRRVLATDPQNAAAMNFIGYALAEKGQGLDEAERLLNRALELRPDNGSFLDSLGWIYFRRGDFARAVGTLERAAALEPQEPVISEHLGDAYRGASRNLDAVGAYRHALGALGQLNDPGSNLQRAAIEHKLKLLSTEARAQ